MARKNLLAGLVEAETGDQVSTSAAAYPIRGASKSMIRSVNELAKQADAYLEGEHVVELDPNAVDGSFVSDRMGDDKVQYQELLEAIRERGQDSPILVRPHPGSDGRYMIVFGHRRVRIARELGRKVRAVVKDIDDKTHVIAQGQENSARANLSFIEKAMFAKRLEDLGYDRDVISSALASNAAAVSKMVSVVTRIPASVIGKIGSAASVGRERWVELSLLAGKKSEMVNAILSEPEFGDLESNERFERLLAGLNGKGKPVRKAGVKPAAQSWVPEDKSVSVSVKKAGRAVAIAVKGMDGSRFGTWISDNLGDLYEAFRKSEKTVTGD
ncbi:plasmid partitioning protein RepB [Mesorhizobium sp. CU2]|uniref:plasmid partitioning protein RepB n=1 Tax=unclassified Mesorhizobium TaxID=325217 RepID=UPI00112E4EC2|nr:MULTISPECIES: plasmid partitioning protein RepB [unclassified Mesorhizobium]TPN81032.1 plasmid partitioning protein RepB [Mesorhizobium sp. CU3]TPO11486.1 plasmid partitioning protein RepB [Mesorhizobium sp. CU2]